MLCRPSSRVDRWAKSGGLVGGHPRLCIDTRLPLLRPGGGRELSRRRAVRAPRHGARPRRSLGRARRCSCDGVAGTPQRRHRVARHSRAQLGGQSQPSAPSLVALRAVLDEISEALGHRRPEIAYWRIASVATASLDGSDRGMSKRADGVEATESPAPIKYARTPRRKKLYPLAHSGQNIPHFPNIPDATRPVVWECRG